MQFPPEDLHSPSHLDEGQEISLDQQKNAFKAAKCNKNPPLSYLLPKIKVLACWETS